MKDLILLNPKAGAPLRWDPPTSFSFLGDRPMLPTHAGEVGRLASALPLAILKDTLAPSGWSLVAVCGLTEGQNALIDQDGRWHGRFLPQSVQYLPFAMKDIGGGNAIAAIDPRYAKHVLKLGNEGVPMFDETGQLHEAARKRVDLLSQHQGRITRTQQMLSALDRAGLMVPWPQHIAKSIGMTIKGLYTIEEKKLSELPDDAFLNLRKSGALAVAYSCLLSLYHVHNLAKVEPSPAKADSASTVQTIGDLDLEFLNDSDTIKFGPLS